LGDSVRVPEAIASSYAKTVLTIGGWLLYMILLKEMYNTIPVLELLVIARYKGNYMTGRG